MNPNDTNNQNNPTGSTPPAGNSNNRQNGARPNRFSNNRSRPFFGNRPNNFRGAPGGAPAANGPLKASASPAGTTSFPEGGSAGHAAPRGNFNRRPSQGNRNRNQGGSQAGGGSATGGGSALARAATKERRPKSEQMRARRPAGRPLNRRRPEMETLDGKVDDTENPLVEKSKNKEVPPIEAGVVRIIPLGGVEEIGKNMTAIEMGNSIIIVDIGLAFPGNETPGVDYIIPDANYVEKNKARVKALIVTHGHLDHIGGIPYVLPKIDNPPLYTSELTAVMIKKRQEEFPHFPKPDIRLIKKDDVLKIGDFTVRFFGATHTIPDCFGIILETPFGNVVMTGDLKVENIDGVPADFEVETYSKLGKENNLVLIADSTNVTKDGFSYPEKEVHKNLREIIKNVKGRIVIGTFASLFDRIVAVVQSAEELGKKVVIEGRSMKTNVEIARDLGILKVSKDVIISSDMMADFPEDKLVILATGAQGDEFAALMRMANKEHRTVKIKKGDTVLLSSSVIPGNEKSVERLKDNLSRQGARIIHYGVANVHSSGHSYSGELKWVHKMIKPRYFIPVHGSHYMLTVHRDLAIDLGMPEKNVIVPDNGMVIEIKDGGNTFMSRPELASSNIIMVDGLGNDNIQEVVIRDRQVLAQDGMFVIIAIVDTKTGKVRKSPDIISRGFVYLKESQELLTSVRVLVKRTIEEVAGQMHPINYDYVKNIVREDLGKYLFQKTLKRPIIIPVLIEV
jgi:ribonuclease J